jgi:hypothetical protein
MAVETALIDWNPEAERALKKANASKGDLQAWRAEVDSGQAQLWQVAGDSVGYLLTRVERYPNGEDELVLVAGAGTNCRPLISWAMKLAASHGIRSIRTHIKRPGLQRIYESLGWHLSERVMRFANGQ